MRRIMIFAVTVAALAVCAAPASAIQSVQKASATVKPNVAGTKSNPQAVSLTVRSFFDTIAPDLDQQVQFATVNGQVWFTKEGLTNAKQFPGCTSAKVFQDEKTCPSGSKVGSGTAEGIGIGLDEHVKLTAFNQPNGKGITVLVVGESPLIIREVVVANLKTLSGDPKYKYELTFAVPKNLQSPAPGVIAAIKNLSLTIPVTYLKKNGKIVKKKGKKVPYIATTGCAAGHWFGKYVADYTTSFDSAIESSQTVELTVPCKKHKK